MHKSIRNDTSKLRQEIVFGFIYSLVQQEEEVEVTLCFPVSFSVT